MEQTFWSTGLLYITGNCYRFCFETSLEYTPEVIGQTIVSVVENGSIN